MLLLDDFGPCSAEIPFRVDPISVTSDAILVPFSFEHTEDYNDLFAFIYEQMERMNADEYYTSNVQADVRFFDDRTVYLLAKVRYTPAKENETAAEREARLNRNFSRAVNGFQEADKLRNLRNDKETTVKIRARLSPAETEAFGSEFFSLPQNRRILLPLPYALYHHKFYQRVWAREPVE